MYVSSYLHLLLVHHSLVLKHHLLQPGPVVVVVRVHLVDVAEVGPGDDDLLLSVVDDGMGTLTGDAHALPQLHSVLNTIQYNYWFSLNIRIIMVFVCVVHCVEHYSTWRI